MKKLIESYKKKQRALSFLLLLIILNNTFFPTAAMALTSGPSQPEVQSFEPIATSEMVDLLSGDFNYNLPLMDVDGYPINMSYHSGITMDQEASWVGLGWNINPGVINRSMRGIPDDFNGEKIVKNNNINDNITVGVTGGVAAAVAGYEGLKLGVGLGVNYNNYVGVGVEQSVSLTFNVSKSGKGPLSSSLGLKSSNSDGLTVSPSISLSARSKNAETGDKTSGTIGVGTAFNSRSGLKSLSISGGIRATEEMKGKTQTYDRGGGIGYSASIDFGIQTFVPHVNIPMRNSSVIFQAQVGFTAFSTEMSINGSGYFSKSSIDQKTQALPGYGYFYEHNGQDLTDVMMDFNREKDGGEFSVNTPGLPVTNHTYDIFNVNGQGVNGAYRLHRSDIGYVFDNSAGSTSDSYALGVEIEAGNTAEVGVDVTVTDVNTTSGKWTADNPLANNTKFKDSRQYTKDYEPAYFKMAGEKVADPDGANANYSKFGKNSQVRAKLQFGMDKFEHLTDGLTTTFEASAVTPVSNQNQYRMPRAQSISYLKVKEKDFMLRPSDISPYVNANDHGGQFAEINVLQPDGKRYVYGKALYNTKQKEVSFNASENAIDCGNGLVSYSGKDNSMDNKNGADHYYSSSEMPGYAHSYLITAVLSPDYIDIENSGNSRGPSSGDFGDYTLFEYQQNSELNDPFSNIPSVSNSTYKWRTPLHEKKANYNEGLRTKKLDDQGNYVYGEKEVVYLKYIKTKNFVAVFELNDPYTEPRMDGRGAYGEDGGVSNAIENQSRYLKTITLYSRPDFEARVANSSHVPFPLKQVHFEYDYILCKGIYDGVKNGTGTDVPTTGQGKLTLTKVYFTYGTSNKGMFSPYEFAYANLDYYTPTSYNTVNALNPAYDPKGYNKWGFYKPNTASTCTYNDALSNAEFPYVEQDHTQLSANPDGTSRIAEDNYVAAWSLTKIKLPSGGEIKINYEADDYAYVQNKQAMEMFKMVDLVDYGAFSNGNFNTSTSNYNRVDIEGQNLANPDYGRTKGIVVKLKTNSRYNNSLPAMTEDLFIKLYLKDIVDAESPIYFREYIKVNGASNNGYEYVSAYAYLNMSVINDPAVDLVYHVGTDTYGFIPLKTEELNLGSKLSAQPQANPLVLAGLKFARTHTSREAFSFAGEPQPNLSAKDLILAMVDASFINTITQTFQGPEKYLYQNKNLGRHIITGKSWIRLYNPLHDKLGGGSRIKNILITDNWNTMDLNEPITNYGQEYDYTTTEVIGGVKMKVSSGISTYEPMLGADDNPFRMPNFSGSKAAPLAPDTRFYLEEPYGESFFPSASVGYSKVKMRSVALAANGTPLTNVKNHATGYTLHEFYTARDYPVLVNRTDMDVKEGKSNLGGRLLKLDVRHNLTASQGFAVELNDMHGKPKASWVFGEGQDSPLSGIQYFYKDNGVVVDNERIHGDKLMNDDVPVLDRNGRYLTQNTFVGLEYDMVADFREEETVTVTAGGQINLYVFYSGCPFMIPPVWPSFSKESTRLRTASFTKVINRYGILEETVAYKDGATISTNNLLWDAETGEVLLTKTKNEFKDDIYALNIPAHLGYKYMGPAYINDGVEGTYGDIGSYLVDGDELIVTVTGSPNPVKAYFFHDASSQPVIAVGNTSTNILSTVTNIKVIRSGRRNMQNVSIGNITFLHNNPLVSNLVAVGSDTHLDFNSFVPANNILNASNVLFTDKTKMNCECMSKESNYNPYYYGLQGNWHPKESYLFLSERKNTTASDPNDKGSVRNDGAYTSFSPFWKTGGAPGQLLNPYTTGWTWTSTLSIYSVEGQELESRDALNRYSAATFGYNNKLPLSVSNNSQYREVGFDGFEDYSFDLCTDPRFKFKNAAGVKASPTKDRSHTGKYSIRVSGNGGKVELKKNLTSCSVGG